jgi:HAD superfamily hydrolase (TIGR01490 family)
MGTISSKSNIPGKNHIAFFDLDRTITKAISGKELAKGAFRKGIMSNSDLIRAIYLSLLFKLNLRDPLKIIDDMLVWVAGIPEQTMIELCNEIFRNVLLPSIYREARGEIIAHKEGKNKVVILSSSLAPICMEIAKTLKMDDFLCSDLEVKNGFLTGHPIGQLCFGEEKVVRLEKYCEINNSKPSDAWYYGDSISDLPVLIAVGNPVCVNPDNKLKKEALLRGWKILQWKAN